MKKGIHLIFPDELSWVLDLSEEERIALRNNINILYNEHRLPEMSVSNLTDFYKHWTGQVRNRREYEEFDLVPTGYGKLNYLEEPHWGREYFYRLLNGSEMYVDMETDVTSNRIKEQMRDILNDKQVSPIHYPAYKNAIYIAPSEEKKEYTNRKERRKK